MFHSFQFLLCFAVGDVLIGGRRRRRWWGGGGGEEGGVYGCKVSQKDRAQLLDDTKGRQEAHLDKKRKERNNNKKKKETTFSLLFFFLDKLGIRWWFKVTHRTSLRKHRWTQTGESEGGIPELCVDGKERKDDKTETTWRKRPSLHSVTKIPLLHTYQIVFTGRSWRNKKKKIKFCVIIDYFLGLLGPFLYFLIFGEKVFLWENPIITHESQMNRLRSGRNYFGSVWNRRRQDSRGVFSTTGQTETRHGQEVEKRVDVRDGEEGSRLSLSHSLAHSLSQRRGVQTWMEEAGFVVFFFSFLLLALVHSYCIFLHISDKRGAFRTVLCEEREAEKKEKGKKPISY